MPEQVLVLGGMPSFAFQPTFDPTMLADLQAVSGLTQEQLKGVSSRLATATGFLGPEQIDAIVRDVVADESVAAALQRTLRSLDPPQVKPLLGLLTERQQAEKTFKLSKTTLESLRGKLPQLVREYPALRRFKKAEHLSRLTGQQLASLELICDVRPVFDDGRERVEGLMPYTRLRIIATGPDGLSVPFEAELTAQQVNALAEKASKAVTKLAALRSSIQEWIPDGLPDLPLTRIPQKG